ADEHGKRQRQRGVHQRHRQRRVVHAEADELLCQRNGQNDQRKGPGHENQHPIRGLPPKRVTRQSVSRRRAQKRRKQHRQAGHHQAVAGRFPHALHAEEKAQRVHGQRARPKGLGPVVNRLLLGKRTGGDKVNGQQDPEADGQRGHQRPNPLSPHYGCTSPPLGRASHVRLSRLPASPTARRQSRTSRRTRSTRKYTTVMAADSPRMTSPYEAASPGLRNDAYHVYASPASTGRFRPASVKTTANTSNASTVRSMRAVCKLGRSSGSVTRRKRCQGVAPNTSAASPNSLGMSCSPDTRMTST